MHFARALPVQSAGGEASETVLFDLCCFCTALPRVRCCIKAQACTKISSAAVLTYDTTKTGLPPKLRRMLGGPGSLLCVCFCARLFGPVAMIRSKHDFGTHTRKYTSLHASYYEYILNPIHPRMESLQHASHRPKNRYVNSRLLLLLLHTPPPPSRLLPFGGHNWEEFSTLLVAFLAVCTGELLSPAAPP